MNFRLACLMSAVLLIALSPAAASDLEDRLERELRGSWGIVVTEIYSDCSGFYNNNDVVDGLVSSKADHRFPQGEMAKVDKINLKRSRLDLFLSLSEPILSERVDGPFVLYDERACKVQLMLELPGNLGRTGTAEEILGLLDRTFDRASTFAEAQQNAGWNGRRRPAYPEDYELTLARHRAWKAEQINVAVADRTARAHRDAVRVTADIRQDRAYLAGFAAGVDEMRSWDEDDCETLIDIRFDRVADKPRKKEEGRGWKDGYRDGQELVFNLYLADLLQGCFVPVPPIPAELYDLE